VALHLLKSEDTARKAEACFLKSTILQLKKDIAMETEGQQHLRVTKSKAETGMCKLKANILRSRDGEGRK
jgi:hypothetical protein